MIGGFYMNEKEKLRFKWKNRVQAYRESGLSMKKYCEKNNLKVHQLYKDDKLESSKWLSVNLNTTNNNQPIFLNIGACKLEIKSGFNQKLLKELVKVLIELC